MIRMDRKLLIVGFALLLCHCTSRTTQAPPLTELSVQDSKSSGKRLIQLVDGLHGLHAPASATRALVAVHGFESRGYEGIYPLIHLHNSKTAVYFYRWNWNQCPQSGADGLAKALGQLMTNSPKITEITVVGHSYGGVISALVAQQWKAHLPLNVHIIASPLGGLSKIGKLCDFSSLESKTLPKAVSWHQWRTQHQLDGAFNRLEQDPQLVNIPGATVTTLPATYRGKRLGHNWSISWVAEQLHSH